MPRNEDIEKFNQSLIRTGNEPEVARARGEEIEPVKTPEQYPMDHNGPLAKVRRAQTPAASNEEASEEASESDQSTDDFLAGLTGTTDSKADDFDDLFDIGGDTPKTEPETKDEPQFDDLFDDGLLNTIQQNETIEDTDTQDTDNFLDSFENSLSNEEELADDPVPISDEIPVSDEIPSMDDHSDIEMPDFGDEQSFDDLPSSDSPIADEPLDNDIPVDNDIPDFGSSDFGDFDTPSPLEDEPLALEDGISEMDMPMDAAEELPNESLFSDPLPDEPADAKATMESLESDFGTDDFPEEFSMGDFEKEFGVMDDVAPKTWEPKPDPKEEEAEAQEAAIVDDSEHYNISPQDYAKILSSLSGMPLNLKIATEEVLGNPEKPFPQIKQLIDKLIEGESPASIAPLVSKLFGKKIKVPAGYSKKTGEAFEREKQSFAYKFKTVIFPLIRTIALTALALLFIAWLVIRFVITPMIANGLYDDGLKAIASDKYDEGNALFAKAYATWPDNNRFVQYGESFAAKNQDSLAYGKYTELLGDIDPKVLPLNMPKKYKEYYLQDRLPKLDPVDRSNGVEKYNRGYERNHVAGVMSFAHFLAEEYDAPFGKYELKFVESIMYLQRLVESDAKNIRIPAIMYQGDVFMKWADYLEDPSKPTPRENMFKDLVIEIPKAHEDLHMDNSHAEEPIERNTLLEEALEAARYDYASLERSVPSDTFYSKFLRYFIARGDAKNVNIITRIFLGQEKLNADAEVIAQLSGVLIDRAQGNIKELETPYKLLRMTAESGSTDSGIFYQLARYHRYFDTPAKEEEVLKETLKAFALLERPENWPETAPKKTLSKQKTGELIDTYIRLGETSEILKKPVIAQDFYQQAVKRYEEAIATRKIAERASDFGRVYALLGDQIYFEGAELTKAHEMYLKAIANQYGENPNKMVEHNKHESKIVFNRPHGREEELWRNYQDISYKIGFIKLTKSLETINNETTRQRLQKESIQHFIDAQGLLPPENVNLMQAIGVGNIELGNWEAAIGQLLPLYTRLKQMQEKISPYLPGEVLSDTNLRYMLYVTTNNLGVAYYNMYKNNTEHANENLSFAQYYMSQSSVIAQQINRDRETNLPQNMLVMRPENYVTDSSLMPKTDVDGPGHGYLDRSNLIKISQLNLAHMLSGTGNDEVYAIPALYKDLKADSVKTKR